MADDHTPTPEPTYTVPDASTQRRESIERNCLKKRAGYLRDLVALAPDNQQDAAMALVLRIERVAVQESDTIERTWEDDVALAYGQGRCDFANEQWQAITGPPAPAAAGAEEPPVIWH